jgi:hypothetical protein
MPSPRWYFGLVTHLRRAAAHLPPSLAAGLVAIDPVATHAQEGASDRNAPRPSNERHGEDWSYLQHAAKRTGHWTEKFKYIELGEGGSSYLTTGLEARSRYEGFRNPNWGAKPDDGYVWNRLLPYADLHAGRARFFVQPIVSAISLTDRERSPVDTTGVDLLQAFAEMEADVGSSSKLRVSVGRKMVSLGAGRFVDTRYGTNVPLAFDGVDATLSGKTRRLRVFRLRPVDPGAGLLDDRASRRRAIWGAYATQWLNDDKAIGLDIFYLGFRDRNAVVDQGAGRLALRTFGVRFFGDVDGWHWNVEGVTQRGSFDGQRVRAGGIASEFGFQFIGVPLEPELALTADYITGDGNPDDNKLGTFTPMFPRGKYFASQSPIGPRNLIHLQPSITIYPGEQVSVSLTGAAYWRESSGDGIYDIPGNVVRSANGSEAHFIGKQVQFAVTWQATPELGLAASVSAFAPGRFIRETGPARTIKVASAEASFRF